MDVSSKMYFHVFEGAPQEGIPPYTALAKREPFATDGFSLLREVMNDTGDLWFEFGDTPDEALEKLKKSLIDEGVWTGNQDAA